MTAAVAVAEVIAPLGSVVDELRALLDRIDRGELVDPGAIRDRAREVVDRLRVENRRGKPRVRRSETGKLAKFLSERTGVEVTGTYDAKARECSLSWTDGPSVEEMTAHARTLAPLVAVDVGEMAYRRAATPVAQAATAIRPEVDPRKGTTSSVPAMNGDPRSPGMVKPIVPPRAAAPEPPERAAPPTPRTAESRAGPPAAPPAPERRPSLTRLCTNRPRHDHPAVRERTRPGRPWRLSDALLLAAGILLVLIAVGYLSVAGADRVRADIAHQVAEQTETRVGERLGVCYEALDRADDAIYSYADGLRAERETDVSEQNRDVRVRAESDTYTRYAEAKQDCRGTPAPPKKPAYGGPITALRSPVKG